MSAKITGWIYRRQWDEKESSFAPNGEQTSTGHPIGTLTVLNKRTVELAANTIGITKPSSGYTINGNTLTVTLAGALGTTTVTGLGYVWEAKDEDYEATGLVDDILGVYGHRQRVTNGSEATYIVAFTGSVYLVVGTWEPVQI